jgi:hypothetical protein
MVTFGFVLVYVLLGSLTILIDVFLYPYSFIEVIKNLYYTQTSGDRLILYLMFGIGFVWSFVTDIRIRKKKRKQ